MGEGRDQAACEDKLHRSERSQSHLSRRADWVAHENQPGLQVTLYPTCALIEPCAQRDGCFFLCWRADHAGALSIACDAITEIGIFGDVE